MKIIFSVVKSDLSTMTGQNLNFLLVKYNMPSTESMLSRRCEVKWSRVNPLEEEDNWKVTLIEEICLAKKDFIDINFCEEDLEEILKFVCTD